MNNLYALYSSMVVQMKQTFSRNMFKFVMLIQPIIFGTILYLMFKDSKDLIYHVIFGTGLITIWGTIVFSSASDVDRERRIGTLEYIFCAPVRFNVIMTGKILGNVILGFFSMIYSSVFLILFFNVKFEIHNILLFILTVVMMVLSFIAISMFFATLLTLSRQARVFMNALDYPIYILCGLVFPIEMLPKYIQYISYALTPTWANQLLQESASGITNYQDFYFKLIILTILTIIYFVVSLIFFKVIDKKTRREATLEVI